LVTLVGGRHVADVIVCAAAEALDAPPSVVRPVLVAAFRRAKELGVSVDDVVDLLGSQGSAPKPKPSKAG
jgi:hypothetical protein